VDGRRAIEEPTIETSLKSSHMGFTETSSKNIALIRRYISTRELKVKECTVGDRAGVKLSILYLADVANEDVVREMEYRLKSLKVDTIINTGELGELIEDNSFTPFPQLSVTERPDTAAYQLLRGRIAVVVDRCSGVLIGPMTFSAFFQNIDDYSFRWIIASFVRLLRFIAFFIAIFVPALYIAMISFHYEVIPLKLLLTLGESREKIPFPPIAVSPLHFSDMRDTFVRLPQWILNKRPLSAHPKQLKRYGDIGRREEEK
jgi:spore germination protein